MWAGAEAARVDERVVSARQVRDREPGNLLAVDAEVRRDGTPVDLTALEFRLLVMLLRRKDRVQSREVLLADVWGMTPDVTTRTVDTHIRRLRAKLGPARDYIETIRGVGYRFLGELPAPPVAEP